MGETPEPAVSYVRGISPYRRARACDRLLRVAHMVGLKVGEGRGLHDLGGDGLRAVREAMLSIGSSPGVVNNALADLRGVTRVAFDMGLVGRDKLAAVEEVRDVLTEKDTPTRVLSVREISVLIAACVRDRSARGARDAAMILIAYASGMFSRELCALDLGSWDARKALLLPPEGSWWKEGTRAVPLGTDAQAAMRRWAVFRGRGPGGLFVPVDSAGSIVGRSIRAPTADRVLGVRTKQAGIEGFSYEDLRRTAILDAYTSGAKPAEVKRIFGHPVPSGVTVEGLQSLASDREKPDVRAVRLGSEHLDYFEIIGGAAAGVWREGEAGRAAWPAASWVSTPFGRVAYRAFGSGRPVLLLHDSLGSSYSWRLVAPTLASSRRVYAYDLLGYGASEKTDGGDFSIHGQARLLKELLRRWGLGSVDVAGHGLGGIVALSAHLQEGVDFRRMALLETPLLPPSATPEELHVKRHAEAYRTMPPEILEATIERRLRSVMRFPLHPETLKEYLAPWQGGPGRSAYVSSIEQLDEAHVSGVAHLLGSLKREVLILWGTRGGALGREDDEEVARARRLQGRITGSRIALLRRSMHALTEEDPQSVSHALLSFFD